MTRQLLGFALALVCSLAACKPEAKQATEVLLEIDAESGVRARLAKLTIEVRGGAADDAYADYGGESRSELQAPMFPVRVALVPRGGDSTRRYQVTASAHAADGSLLAEARVISGYVPDAIRYARLVLQDACLGVGACGEAAELPLTCSRGVCADPRADVGSFASDRNASSPIEHRPLGTMSADGGAPDGGTTTSPSRDAATPEGGTTAKSDAGPPITANDAGPTQGTCKLGASPLPCRLGM
jgi:hypothetical protein